MKQLYIIVALIAFIINTHAAAGDVYDKNDPHLPKDKKESVIRADSIMHMVIANAGRYQNMLESSEVEIYIKGRTEILKSNFLIRFAHHLFPVNRRSRDVVFEMISNSTYQAPNLYIHDIKAINGNTIPNRKKRVEALKFLNLNVYASTAYDDEILMPLAKSAFKYYTFDLIGVQDTAGLKIYQIRFLPRQVSQKLISGDLYIVDKVWSIDKIDIGGRFSFAEFNTIIQFGRGFNRFNLPEKAELYLKYHVLGNAVSSSYVSSFKYKSVIWSRDITRKNRNKSSLDLTRYYELASDTVPVITDSLYWQSKRSIPLSAEEKMLYVQSRDTNRNETDSTEQTNALRYLDMTEKFTSSISFDYKSTRLKYSGLLNPFQLGYSKSNGITYRQRLRLSKTFDNNQELSLRPDIGYVFKRKELYFKLVGEWNYLPEKMGTLSLVAGNGNQSYSHLMMEFVNQQLKNPSENGSQLLSSTLNDSISEFDDLNLQYFRLYYIELSNQIELANGLLFNAKLTYNNRRPTRKRMDLNLSPEILDVINSDYNDFTPSIGLSYTPRQYYSMAGRRKEYLYSYYPTISVEIARAIPNVLNSEGDFTRIEADIHQSVSLGLLNRLNYHVSSGIYTRNKSTYFADFVYFTRRNFPDTWDDQIGGVFNLLGRQWFNASDKYLQAHLMYQSPFIILPLYKKSASRYVFNERIYLSQLWTPVIPSYTEIGYGVGNHIFNIAAFVGFNKLDYYSFGVKFAFELFQ